MPSANTAAAFVKLPNARGDTACTFFPAANRRSAEIMPNVVNTSAMLDNAKGSMDRRRAM